MIVNAIAGLDTLEEATGTSVVTQSMFGIEGDGPSKKPEVEPEKLPEENPGLVPETKPNRDNDEGADDDDDDDDEENDPFTETEIGDDPDEIKTRTTIM